MAYENPRIVSMSFPVSEAIGDTVHTFKAGSTGRLYDINLSTTTTWAGDTNKLIVQVGTSGDADLYGELRSGATANGTGVSARHENEADVSIIHHATNGFEKGDSVVITVTAPAGSGEAGVGICTVSFQMDEG
jgi:hypothetical protein